MIIAIILVSVCNTKLQRVIKNKKKTREQFEMLTDIREDYLDFTDDDDEDNARNHLTFSIIYFVIELLLLIFALQMAFTYSKTSGELFVNLLFAIFLTIPYILFRLLLPTCNKLSDLSENKQSDKSGNKQSDKSGNKQSETIGSPTTNLLNDDL